MDREHIVAAIRRAQEFVARNELQRIPDGFRARPRKGYRGGKFRLGDEPWTVCTAPMISSSFQLLDATVNARLERETEHAVALLDARPDGTGPEPTPEYLRKYQQVAWSALGVVWVPNAGNYKGKFLADPNLPTLRSDDGSKLVAHVESRLRQLRMHSRPKKSREAEEKIVPEVEKALCEVDLNFKRDGRQYGGFWRRPQADGIWRRSTGAPLRFGVEVKLDEDAYNPLCQAVELLGHVDAMVYVRIQKLGGREAPGPATRAKNLLERALPIRYLDLQTA
jgi:hypothetical protein